MTSANYPKNKTALILIDVLNDFLSEDGKVYDQIKPMLEKTDLINNLIQLLEGARKVGIKIIFAPHGLDKHSFDDLPHVLPRFQWAKENEIFWKGSEGADFYKPLYPIEGEIIIGRHHMFNSFFGTDLEEQLQANGIEKVVLAGLTSQTCVEGTGRHALEAGYHVTFLKDGVAEFTEQAHKAAVEISYPTFGHENIEIAEFLEVLQASV